MNITLTNKSAAAIIKNSKTFVSVQFVKKDGSVRNMVCRTGVKKGIKGVGMKYNPVDYGLLTVYDVQKQAYRNINVNTLLSVKTCGVMYSVKN